MPRLTVNIDDEHNETLEAFSGDGGEYDSKSEVVRTFIQAGEDRHELHERIAQLEDRLEDRQERIATLEQQLSDLRDFKTEHEDMRPRFKARGERISQLKDQLEAKDERIDELKEQLERRHDIKNEIQDLPDKIRGQESYTEKRQRKLDQAGFAQRLKWRITGVPVDDDS